MSQAYLTTGASLELLHQWGDPAALIAHRLLQCAARAVLANLWDTLRGQQLPGGHTTQEVPPVTIKDFIESIFDLIGGDSFDPLSGGGGVMKWAALWVLLPMAALAELVNVKAHHMLQLIERHLRRPLWTVIATFVRRAVGDVAMQLQVVIAVLHVSSITIAHHFKSPILCEGDASVEAAGHSQKAVSAALDDFFVLLQESSVSRSGHVETTTNSSSCSDSLELFYGITEAMQLHTSDYLRLMQDCATLLAQVRDEVQAIAARVRLQGPQQGSSNQERDEFFQASGQFHAQLQSALQFHRHPEFRKLVEVYGSTTVKPYSSITQRNEGLSKQHVHLLNASFSPVVVVLLTSYHNTTNLVAQYKQRVDARNATLKSQTALLQLLVGAQLLEEQNKRAGSTVEEVITHCDALQTLLKTIQQWTNTSASTLLSDAIPLGRSTSTGGELQSRGQSGGGESAPTVLPSVGRGRKAEHLFLLQTLRSVDIIVCEFTAELDSIVASCSALEETSQHLLDALRGLRHDQSTTLFPLGQLAAKVLREVHQLRGIIEQEASFAKPPVVQPENDTNGCTTMRWEDIASQSAPPEGAPLLTVAARRSLMVLASTVATIHDACCLIVPAVVVVQETMQLHLEVVRREQQSIAFEIVELHETLSKMQAQSIRVEEAQSDEATTSYQSEAVSGKDVTDDAAFTATLKDAVSATMRTAQRSALDITFVSEIMTALHREDRSVAALVHAVVSGLRDTSDTAAKECFDAVACYCTVVELLSKCIFPTATGTGAVSAMSSRSSSVVPQQSTGHGPHGY